MHRVIEVLQVLGLPSGYKVIDSKVGILVIPFRLSCDSPQAFVGSALEHLRTIGVRTVGPALYENELWTIVKVTTGGETLIIQFFTLEKQGVPPKPVRISQDTSARLVILMFFFYIFGVVVSPGWWKLGAVLLLPPYYFAVEFLLKVFNLL